MAAWVIGYGFIQAFTPKVTGSNQGIISAVKGARLWGFCLAGVSALLAAVITFGLYPTWSLLIGLSIFGVVFAMNSSIHSYLILAYTERDAVSANVGFYYMANAVGRLSGTLFSGIIYLAAGLVGCLWAAALFCGISAIVSLKFPMKSNAE